jgi:hypothetical protein
MQVSSLGVRFPGATHPGCYRQSSESRLGYAQHSPSCASLRVFFLALRLGTPLCFCLCHYYYSAQHYSLYGYRRGEQCRLTQCEC